ncbi:mitogen-activated protein kinase kinase kinase kinase 1-like [Anastrepha obliqua]|uniref:mitogen-activated protein kinase kinase kinase kinase 1-like n=1 Tax=Anastrepha obliqua TaxID=95512 RepID=UPI0024098025|nr:mitogen-activated protein kinase kinase kinase kinase 1-like [Anastrepha obliqua]
MAHGHHNAANLLSSDISRRNPQDEYELIQKIGSGTYGDVYKVKNRARPLNWALKNHTYTPFKTQIR